MKMSIPATFFRRKRLWLSPLVCLSLLQGAYGVQAGEAAFDNSFWEKNARQKPDPISCITIDSALVVSVVPARRDEAVRRLHQHDIVPLSEADAAVLLGQAKTKSEETISASFFVKAKIEELVEKRRHQFEDHKGGWSVAEQTRLEELRKLGRNSMLLRLRPFLVEAAAKNEQTGGLVARICSETLWINHSSLGVSGASTVRTPIIAFLAHSPKRIYLSFSIAE